MGKWFQTSDFQKSGASFGQNFRELLELWNFLWMGILSGSLIMLALDTKLQMVYILVTLVQLT